MSMNVEFKKVYPNLDPDDAIVGEDGPYPFGGGELTEVWFQEGDEYSTCYYLSHPKHGIKDFESMCDFVNSAVAA